MSDEKLKLFTKIAAVFLVVAVAFCIFAIISSNKQEEYMERRRIENETNIAKLQQPILESDEEENTENNASEINTSENNTSESLEKTEEVFVNEEKTVVVIDAGHGKSSSQMSDEEKIEAGYEYNSDTGNWGEWRHYKNGTFGENCNGTGCTGLCPENSSCWYSIGNGDRDTEPEITLNNALAAKKYLEQMGYEVRMTRTSNDENPSMDKRVSYCFPDGDITASPDAAVYVCIHSNAGGGSGTSYISLEEPYTQNFIDDEYVSKSNRLGDILNTKVSNATGLSQNSPISSPYLILFNKCPVPIAYLEIGFFDNQSDLEILQLSSDEIGKAIAEGIDEYLKN